MKKLKLKSNAFQGNGLSREQLKKVLGGVTGSGSESCTQTCDGGQTKYICYDVLCAGARREVCSSTGRPSGFNNCSIE